MALIELRPGVYIKTIWFASSEEQDMLAVLCKDEECWHFKYRFRDYDPESTDPFDGKDEKRFYHIKGETPEVMMVVIDKLFKQASNFGFELVKWDIEKEGNDPSIVETMKDLPFMHVKVTNEN